MIPKSLKARHRFSAACAAITLATTALTAGPAVSASLSESPSNTSGDARTSVPADVLASAPRYITGYTDHCETRLKQRKISKGHAEPVVENNWRSAYKDRKHGTWQYQDKTVLISLNNSGACVTATRL